MTKYVGGYNTGPTAIYKLLFIQVLTSENQERESNTNNVYVRGMRPPHALSNISQRQCKAYRASFT